MIDGFGGDVSIGRGDGKIHGESPTIFFAVWSSSRARGERGTWWAILFLAFSGGLVHHLPVKSISSQVALTISTFL
jgi:hypothetical protein